MTTLKVERFGDDWVIRLPADAGESLGLRPGDEVHLTRSFHGEVSLVGVDIDHQLRIDRSRAFLRRYRSPS